MRKLLWIGIIGLAIMLPMQVLAEGILPNALSGVGVSGMYANNFKGDSAAIVCVSVDLLGKTLGNGTRLELSGDIDAVVRDGEKPLVGLGASVSAQQKGGIKIRAGAGWIPDMGLCGYVGIPVVTW